MARLPQPGGDDGTWGNLLNDFLAQEHNSDGTLKIKTDGTLAAKANDNNVVHLSGNQTISGIKTYNSSPVVPTPLSNTQAANKAYVDSTAGAGDPVVGGDLTGTASNAQIATGAIVNADVNNAAAIAQSKIANLTTDLAAKIASTEKGAASGVASLDSGTRVPVVQLPDSTTTTKGIIQLTGDLAGTAASPTVPGLTNKINSSEKGQPNGVAVLDGSGKVNPGQLQTSNITKVLPYSYLGNVAVGPGAFRLYNDTGATWTITGVRASVGTAPTGASLIVDVNKNGSTIFTTQANRPAIPASANTSGNVTTMDITTVAAGEYLTIDIDQIGSTIAGADLTVQLEVY